MTRREIKEVLEENGARDAEPGGAGGERVERIVALGRALSDPIRVQMLGMLAEGRGCRDLPDLCAPVGGGSPGICVCEFEGYYGMGQSKVSYHLGKLKEAGLVREERRGRWSFYSLDREAAGRLLGEAGNHLGVALGWEARRRVLFLCTHNSARSQMAEGLLRHLAGDRFEAMSAGTEAASVRPEAIAAMAELGVDISGQESKTLDHYLDEPFDYVITVCDAASEACQVFPGAKKRLHWSFRDPSRATGDEERRLEVFREVRDEILARIEKDLVPVGREPLTSS